MQSGFNTNYRHRGVVFHVQTEDSGRANPHVITHLFHGGNIIRSEKVEYRDRLDAEDLETAVRELMESQHKKMLKALSRGECDDVIRQRMGAHVFGEHVDTSDTIPPIPADSEPSVGVPTHVEIGPASEPPPPAAMAEGDDSTKDRIARAFGDGVVSDKPLDEVVLDYLVENARKRKRSTR